MNVIHIIGNLGNDPELRFLSDGTACCKISVATNEQWTDKAGNKQKRTQWHRVVFWAKRAEVVNEWFRSGDQIAIEGSMVYDKWTDDKGVERTSAEIKATNFHFVGGKKAGNDGQSKAQTHDAETSFDQSFNDDDIPF